MINLFEFFSGIGATHKALSNNKESFKSVGVSEWFISAILSYNYLYYKNKKLTKKENYENIFKKLEQSTFSKNSKTAISKISKSLKQEEILDLYKANKNINNFGEISKIQGTDLKDLDINVLTYSFPCQDISLQGKQIGLSQDSNSRSSLVWEILRILKQLKELNKLPKVLMMENVKNIFSKKFIKDFESFKKELAKLGYKNSPNYILNSSNFGSSQNRERAFLISVLSKEKIDWKTEEEIAKLKTHPKKTLKDILEEDPSDEYMPPTRRKLDPNWRKTKNNIYKTEILDYTNFQSEKMIYHKDFNGPTLTASGANNRLKIFIEEGKIKILSAKECLKYMGFDAKDYDILKSNGIKDSKIRFMAGNSIPVSVLENLFIYIKSLLKF